MLYTYLFAIWISLHYQNYDISTHPEIFLRKAMIASIKNPRLATPMQAKANFTGVFSVHALKNKIMQVFCPFVVSKPRINMSVPEMQNSLFVGSSDPLHSQLHVVSIVSHSSFGSEQQVTLFTELKQTSSW